MIIEKGQLIIKEISMPAFRSFLDQRIRQLAEKVDDECRPVGGEGNPCFEINCKPYSTPSGLLSFCEMFYTVI